MCGYVDSLGVLKEWRGRGIGKALLRRGFAELAGRGSPEVRLGVDTQNVHGAVALYEGVGMSVYRRYDVFHMGTSEAAELTGRCQRELNRRGAACGHFGPRAPARIAPVTNPIRAVRQLILSFPISRKPRLPTACNRVCDVPGEPEPAGSLATAAEACMLTASIPPTTMLVRPSTTSLVRNRRLSSDSQPVSRRTPPRSVRSPSGVDQTPVTLSASRGRNLTRYGKACCRSHSLAGLGYR